MPGATTSVLLLAVASCACALLRSTLPAWPVAAFLWTAFVASGALADRLAPSADGRDWRVAGWVDGIPAASLGRTVFSLRVDDDGPLAHARLRLSWYEPPARIEPGDRLALTVRLRHPRGLANPAGFDYERWLFLEGYAATGYVRDSHAAAVAHDSLAAQLLGFRWRLAERVRAQVADAEAAAVMTALAVGERSGISDELWTVLRRTGTSHLIAISGLHISLVSGLCFLVVAALARRSPLVIASRELEIAWAAALIAGSGYAALAGFALPTRRAAIMVAFAGVVVLSRRRIGVLNGVSVATIIVLALDPLATLSASFWMSFAAVAVLLVCALPRRIELEPPGRPPLRRRIARAAALQCQLTLALAPLSAAFFGGVSLLAIPVNLLAIPIFCLALIPLTLVAVLGLAVLPSFTLLARLAGSACAVAADALGHVAALPAALIETQAASPLALGIAAVGVGLALPWHRAPGRRSVWLALVPLFVPRSVGPPAGQLDVLMLDVGHGLAIVLTTQRHRLVYDAGPMFRSGFDAGAEILVPTLRQDRARAVDLIVLSHADSDHSGGAPALLEAHPEARVLHGPDIELDRGRACVAGERWQWDGVEFEIVHPDRDFARRGNDSSCVLRVRTAAQSMLLTGDIERAGELALLRRDEIDVDIVVVPHHGSATSSSPGLVARTTPTIALVSAGYGNQWGFPVPTVRERWRAAGAMLYVTGDDGAIALRLGGPAPDVRLERAQRRRYWHADPATVPGETKPSTL